MTCTSRERRPSPHVHRLRAPGALIDPGPPFGRGDLRADAQLESGISVWSAGMQALRPGTAPPPVRPAARAIGDSGPSVTP